MDPSVSAAVHYVAMSHHKAQQQYGDFYKAALLYLAHVRQETLPADTRLVRWWVGAAQKMSSTNGKVGWHIGRPMLWILNPLYEICTPFQGVAADVDGSISHSYPTPFAPPGLGGGCITGRTPWQDGVQLWGAAPPPHRESMAGDDGGPMCKILCVPLLMHGMLSCYTPVQDVLSCSSVDIELVWWSMRLRHPSPPFLMSMHQFPFAQVEVLQNSAFAWLYELLVAFNNGMAFDQYFNGMVNGGPEESV